MENRVHTIEPEAGRMESTLAPMTDDEHDDRRRPLRRQATGDRRQATGDEQRAATITNARVQCTHLGERRRNDERNQRRINQLSSHRVRGQEGSPAGEVVG